MLTATRCLRCRPLSSFVAPRLVCTLAPRTFRPVTQQPSGPSTQQPSSPASQQLIGPAAPWPRMHFSPLAPYRPASPCASGSQPFHRRICQQSSGPAAPQRIGPAAPWPRMHFGPVAPYRPVSPCANGRSLFLDAFAIDEACVLENVLRFGWKRMVP